MVTLRQSHEGGTNGSTVAISDPQAPGDTAYGLVTVGAGSSVTYDNAHPAHGSLGCHIVTGATAAQDYAAWTTAIGSPSQAWFRQYLYFSALPSANHRVFAFLSSGTGCGSVLALTTGKLRFVDTAGVTIFTTAASFPIGQQFRIEGFVIFSATVGQVELKMFTASADAVTPDETD